MFYDPVLYHEKEDSAVSFCVCCANIRPGDDKVQVQYYCIAAQCVHWAKQ